MRRYISFSLMLLVMTICFGRVGAQDTQETSALELPDCDIFVFDVTEQAGKLKLSHVRNITDRPGYDNQPWFTPDSSSVLYTCNRKPDRTDIYEYHFDSEETKQVTDSETQEYSPQISEDNRTVSYVTDGATANQSIWYEDRDGGKPRWLLGNQDNREPVGYYSWNRKTGYILFWSRYGFSMRLVHESKPLSHFVCGNAVPTTPHIVPGTNKFSFMHQQLNGEVWIKELDPESLAVRPITKVIGSNRNYGWTPSGKILMCDGTKLHRWSLDSEEGWQLVTDLEKDQIKNVTRVAMSPDGKRLAVVGLPKQEAKKH